MISLEDYTKAAVLIDNYVCCGCDKGQVPSKSITGCGRIIPIPVMQSTVQMGQTKYWCGKCYPHIKNS